MVADILEFQVGNLYCTETYNYDEIGQCSSRLSSLKSNLIGLIRFASWGCSLTESYHMMKAQLSTFDYFFLKTHQ